MKILLHSRGRKYIIESNPHLTKKHKKGLAVAAGIGVVAAVGVGAAYFLTRPAASSTGGCTNSTECPPAQQCVNGKCLPISPPNGGGGGVVSPPANCPEGPC